MVEATRQDFEKVYSIELSQELFERAKLRFAAHANVELLQGDSGRELGKLIPRIQKPTVFWLDGHYSAGFTARGDKDTPILEELGHSGRRIMGMCSRTDDARCFGTSDGYPAIKELKIRQRPLESVQLACGRRRHPLHAASAMAKAS